MTELTCIVCPRGCRLRVDEQNDYAVSGNCCPRGAQYGKLELTAPTRRVTSTVRVAGGNPLRRCPVKTSAEIPRALVRQAVLLLDAVTVEPPLAAGSVVLRDLCGTGADWVTTRELRADPD